MKRKRNDVHSYDETKRRGKRCKVEYLAGAPQARKKRDSIQMGAAALERVTRGRYEWRGEVASAKKRRSEAKEEAEKAQRTQ